MTGLYKESILKRRREAFSDVRRVKDSLASLKNKTSSYADEHRALIGVLQKVADVYESAPVEVSSNA